MMDSRTTQKPTPDPSREGNLLLRSFRKTDNTQSTKDPLPGGVPVGRGGFAKGRNGFTLMEIMIAIAVVAIGMTALFSLISTGLHESAKAVAETQAAIFADGVFHGLRSASLAAAETPDPDPQDSISPWMDFWNDFSVGSTNLFAPGYTNSWMEASAVGRGKLDIWGNNTIRTNWFAIRAFTAEGVSGITNHVLRYKCHVQSLGGGTVRGDIFDSDDDLATVSLLVWEGEFGNADTNAALEFYTEFDNPGDI